MPATSITPMAHAGALIPQVALVRLVPIGISKPHLRERGTVVIDGDRESSAAKLLRNGPAADSTTVNEHRGQDMS